MILARTDKDFHIHRRFSPFSPAAAYSAVPRNYQQGQKSLLLLPYIPTTGLIPFSYLWSLHTTAHETCTGRLDLQEVWLKQKHLSTSLDWTYAQISKLK